MALGVPFGNYRLVRRIARGGMAEVFLAWQTSPEVVDEDDEGARGPVSLDEQQTGIRFRRQVAVKRILPHLSESDEFRALFLQEARLAATLSHPHVVHIYDFGRRGDSLYIAMELIDGVSLLPLIQPDETFSDQRGDARPPPLPIEHAVRIAADALAGLHHAHTRTDLAGRPLSIVHRDVSPANLMITFEGVVKVLDFGIAKAAWSQHETRKGVVRGKYAYMSPEQTEGQKLDGRSDLYAVGVCLFELLAGAPLLPRGLPLSAALRAVRSGGALADLSRLPLVRPEVPKELLAILRRALQPRREARYPSAAEMQLDLERFLKGWPGLSSPVLLGEFLRAHHPRPSLFVDEAPSEATPPAGVSLVDVVDVPLLRGEPRDADETETLVGGPETLLGGPETLPGGPETLVDPPRPPAATVPLAMVSEPAAGDQRTVLTWIPEQSHGRGDVRPLRDAATGRVQHQGGGEGPPRLRPAEIALVVSALGLLVLLIVLWVRGC